MEKCIPLVLIKRDDCEEVDHNNVSDCLFSCPSIMVVDTTGFLCKPYNKCSSSRSASNYKILAVQQMHNNQNAQTTHTTHTTPHTKSETALMTDDILTFTSSYTHARYLKVTKYFRFMSETLCL